MVLSINIVDYDGSPQGGQDDKIDEMVIVIILDVSGRSSSRTTHAGRSGYASIDLSARVSCAENFYGSDCGTLCVERDDVLGHYNCSSEGDPICLDGYRYPVTNCTECIPAIGCCKLKDDKRHLLFSLYIVAVLVPPRRVVKSHG